LYLTALEKSNEIDSKILQHLFSINPKNSSEKIEAVTTIFKTSGAASAMITEIENYTQKANLILNDITISEENKMILQEFGSYLMKRTV